MKTAAEYTDSLRDLRREVYVLGERVDDALAHPILRPSLNALAMTYQMAWAGAHKHLMVRLDKEGRKDILFLGPDERTAELMNWAALYARKRKYPYWKAFTTGKALELGGIPHDIYGMTTNSVHEYVLGVLEKLGLKEEAMVKIQTGGPDGDLGSNEILISKDKTIAVVDGSGVLYDPAGLDRKELRRLARKRVVPPRAGLAAGTLPAAPAERLAHVRHRCQIEDLERLRVVRPHRRVFDGQSPQRRMATGSSQHVRQPGQHLPRRRTESHDQARKG